MSDVATLIAEARRYSEAPSTVDALAAEIAELNHRLDIAEEERHARRGQLERLREAKDTFFRNAEAWEAKCNAAWKERDEAKAEKEGWYDMYMMAKNETGQANAEIARLREALKPFAEAAEEYDELDEDSQCIWGASFNTLGDLRRAAAALKPDTGE